MSVRRAGCSKTLFIKNTLELFIRIPYIFMIEPKKLE
jgi:hypothetical protein